MSSQIKYEKKKTSRMVVDRSSNQEGLYLATKRLKGKEEKRKIASRVVLRTNIFQKGFGLMFHKKIHDEAHIFIFDKEQKVALTMWFVFFPIDVIYLNKQNLIVEMKENFRPFSNYYPTQKSMIVIELPVRSVSRYNLKKGNKLLVEQ